MRVPVSSPQTNHSPNPKLTSNIITLHSTPPSINPTLSYEPTSVLDLCHSPSPEKIKPTHQHHSTVPKPHPEEHNLEWWDSIMKNLGLHDDSATPLLKAKANNNNNNNNNNNPNYNPSIPDFPPSQEPDFTSTLSDIYTNQNLSYNYNNTLDNLVHDFNPQNNNSNNGFDFIEELIGAADCFDSNNLQLAQAILDQLNQRLRSTPLGKPLHRVAFHFKDSLRSVLMSGSNRMNTTPRLSSMEEIVQTITTFKAFSGISPIPMFSIFTTNQALLEALHGCSFMHVVDFEIGFGIQYASLMKEIADKAVSPPLLRITAVVPEEYVAESRLLRENLNQFAHELGIRIQVEFVPLRTFETASFKAVRFVDGEKTAVTLSPAIFRRLGGTGTAAFLADVRRISPGVVVFIDGEGWTEAAAAVSFRHGVVSSMEFYSMMLESLDASVAGGGGGGDWVRRIEMLLLSPKIFAAVEGAGRRAPPWREAFYGAGMMPVQLSQFADFQAECLLAKVQFRGFHVAKRQAELVLFWHERAMVAMSAWRC